jgi:hypothetical protein
MHIFALFLVHLPGKPVSTRQLKMIDRVTLDLPLLFVIPRVVFLFLLPCLIRSLPKGFSLSQERQDLLVYRVLLSCLIRETLIVAAAKICPLGDWYASLNVKHIHSYPRDKSYPSFASKQANFCNSRIILCWRPCPASLLAGVSSYIITKIRRSKVAGYTPSCPSRVPSPYDRGSYDISNMKCITGSWRKMAGLTIFRHNRVTLLFSRR